MSSFYYLQMRANERARELHREAATASAAQRAVSKHHPHLVYASLRACKRTVLAMFSLLTAVRCEAITSIVLLIGAGVTPLAARGSAASAATAPHSLPHVTALSVTHRVLFKGDDLGGSDGQVLNGNPPVPPTGKTGP
jgi:hypothetical protein